MNKLQITGTALVLAAIGFTSAASAQTIYVTEKVEDSYQGGNYAPETYLSGGYLFQDVESSDTYSSVTGPGGTNNIPSTLNGGGNYAYKSSAYDTQAELDAAFPDSTPSMTSTYYTFNPSGPSNPLAGDQYPLAPQLTLVNGVTPTWNTSGDLVLDPTVQNVFTWTAFSATNTEGFSYSTGGFIRFSLTGGTENVRETALGPDGQSAFDTNTADPIGANTLANNSTYYLTIGYFLADAGSGTSTVDAAGYEGDTVITVVTPEPSTVGLFLAGAGLLVLLPRLRRPARHAVSVRN